MFRGRSRILGRSAERLVRLAKVVALLPIDEATIVDPLTFSRPWPIRMPLYRRAEPDAPLLEFKCVEFSEELLYGHLTKKAVERGEAER